MQYFVGIDVSKGKLDIGWLQDVNKMSNKTKKISNTTDGHQQVERWILKMTKSQPQEVLVNLEPTGIYHEALA